jgi:hypothetical protein
MPGMLLDGSSMQLPVPVKVILMASGRKIRGRDPPAVGSLRYFFFRVVFFLAVFLAVFFLAVFLVFLCFFPQVMAVSPLNG